MAAACSMIISITPCQPSVFTSTPACAATPGHPSLIPEPYIAPPSLRLPEGALPLQTGYGHNQLACNHMAFRAEV